MPSTPESQVLKQSITPSDIDHTASQTARAFTRAITPSSTSKHPSVALSPAPGPAHSTAVEDAPPPIPDPGPPRPPRPHHALRPSTRRRRFNDIPHLVQQLRFLRQQQRNLAHSHHHQRRRRHHPRCRFPCLRKRGLPRSQQECARHDPDLR